MVSLLPFIWAGIIAFCIFMYVILDGFTLGTALLFPWLNETERNQALTMILPTWDGNQTWLVLGGASLYGAFPAAFSALLPVLYLPLFLMVLALLLRGVSFEFRLKSKKGKRWDLAFIIGSLAATFIQGLILGDFVKGYQDFSNQLIPSFSWLSAYALFTGIALVFGYALLGATRLILKMEGLLAQKMRKIARFLSVIILIAIALVSLWTLFLNPHLSSYWLAAKHGWVLITLPILTVITWLGLFYALKRQADTIPFWLSVLIFCFCYLGFAIAIWPYIVPYYLTIWQAASPPSSLKFMLVGAAIMIPVLLVYTGYAYKIFGGKVRENLHY